MKCSLCAKMALACFFIIVLAGCGVDWFPETTAQTTSNTTPNQFSFISPNKPVNFSPYSSNAVTITGINAPATIIIAGNGLYSIDGGAQVSTLGSITNNQKVKIFHIMPTAGKYKSTLLVGGVFANFSTTYAP